MKPRIRGCFTLALAQMQVDGGEREAKLQRAGRMIAAATPGRWAIQSWVA